MPTIVIPKEIAPGESRAAMTPLLMKRLRDLHLEIKIESGLGAGIFAADSAYQCEIIADKAALYAYGDIVIKVQPPMAEEVVLMKEGAVVISFLYPYLDPEMVKKMATKKITALAMELIPRISRAQDMDALSSQATIVGYKAVLIAANACRFFFPMLTTAAGTIKPARVLVIGAGVAGLQAIAIARRLGAMVSAYDVRPDTKQQVESLGAKFLDVGVAAGDSGGYARELTAEEKAQQQQVLAKHLATQDVVIATAGVPGKLAPKIITSAMVEAMKPGAVIVDAMAEMGGNCELARAGETILYHDVQIIGAKNIVSSLAVNASEMYARNVLNVLNLVVKNGKIAIDLEDEIIKNCRVEL